MRNATGGRALEAPAEAWVHDLQATSRFTELWPWLLVLALLLWPLDIALRRVSLGRRELADGRRWVGDRARGRRVARRTQQTDDLFAARERAGSAGARAAIVRQATGGPDGADVARTAGRRPRRAPTVATAPGRAERPQPTPGTRRPAPAAGGLEGCSPAVPASAARRSGSAAGQPAGLAAAPAGEQDTLARLREAKRRTRG